MDLNDFRCMRNGLHLGMVAQQDASLLKTFEKSSGKKNTALLMLHGFSSSPAVFRLLLPFCDQYDKIIAPVLPAHGQDLKAFSNMDRRALFTFVEKQCDSLLKEYSSVDVLGLSMGGLLACYLSSQFQLNHLFLLAPAIELHLALEKCMALTRLLTRMGFKLIRNLAGNLHSSQMCEIAYRQLPLTSILEILQMVKHFSLSMPTCPTDLFLGRHDAVVASASVAQRFENISNIRIHWLENSSHVLPLDGDVAAIQHALAGRS